MLNTLIVGASGYAGAELVSLRKSPPTYDHNRFDRLSAKQ
ncbi:Uncharacterised protein [Salmonella enterica subsp. enterica serovar Sanjuan]|uniref:N-acetyl-gamma-glutamyl-phosphate reductase n=1 Tax=Salmonella enterica subsp. enterica serovar Sanjuan TaxID=1160765 RepID=A0A447P2F5_SALET|nr:Uncharacterised protein [Salmonella enterica subsp. enterica serovar Sanjuan]